MNTITVEFQGICTFVSPTHLPELPVRERVVLVNASCPTYINTVTLPRHKATLTVSQNLPITLEGVQLWLTIEGGAQPPFERFLQNLPHLKSLMDGIQPLSAPSSHMVMEGHARDVACWFDISFGTLTTAITPDHAVYTTLVAASEGQFQLNAHAFPDGGKVPAELVTPMDLPSGTTLTVANLDDAAPPAKTMADFLLHYRVAEQMPAVPQVPQLCALKHVKERRAPYSPFNTIGAGCSNSAYP